MLTLKLSRRAMGSLFEVVVCGNDATFLRSAAEEALAEIDRLEDQMSLYLPSSELCAINARAARESVLVEPRLYRLFERALEIHRETGGAFDMAVAPVVDAWGFYETAHRPEARELAAARRISGMRHVLFSNGAVRFARQGVALDLGAIGKGYALDRAAEILRAKGIATAFLHGGTSSIVAIGAPPGEPRGWPVGMADPRDPERRLSTVYLKDRSLSASSGFGKFFVDRGRQFGHILDPRTGRPVQGMAAAWTIAPTGADSDALSTAFFVMGPEAVRDYLDRHPGIDGVVLTQRSRIVAQGIELSPSRRGRLISRRDFIKGTAAAVAAFSVGLPNIARSQDRDKEMKLAVIGVGEHGRLLLSQLVRLKGAKVIAVADPYKPHLTQAREIAGKNVETYDDYKQLLSDEDPQAVIVATPPHMHAEICAAALARGRHVFCEAPLALSLEDCRKIVRAAREAKKVFQVGHQRRTSKLYPHALTHIKSGAIGSITHYRAQWQRKQSWRRAVTDSKDEKLLNWRLYRETSGGLLSEFGSHQIDLMNWYLNAPPVAVSGFGALVNWKDGREIEDSIQVMFEYPGGVLVQWCGSLTNSFQEEFELVMGTSGAILLTGQRRGLLFREADAVAQGWEVYAKKEMLGGERGLILDAEATKYHKQTDSEDLGPDAGKADYYAELEHFLECVNRGQSPACGALAGLQSAVACIVAGEAVAKRQVIKFDPTLFEVSK